MRKIKIASWSNVLPTETYLEYYKDSNLPEMILDKKFIPRGAGRSFGDSAYITNGITLLSTNFNKIIRFDKVQGIVTCQSGVLMRELFLNIDGSGWELPVMGGSGWVTVGGAVASDIHSKNHSTVGTFGNHILEIEVITSNGKTTICSESKNKDLFSATIGGMGLSGFIKTVTIKLRRRKGNTLALTTTKFIGLNELFRLFENDKSEHRVGWIDFSQTIPRGIYYSAENTEESVEIKDKSIKLKFPRIKLLNSLSIQFVNSLRYLKVRNETIMSDPLSFHWATDSMKNYNNLFGTQGFHEFQFVAPIVYAEQALHKFKECFQKYNLRPSFIVLKKFGTKKSPGILSFPMEGYTVNPSFEVNRRNDKFFQEFTEYIISIGGRFYLSKDSTLTSNHFLEMYKNANMWQKIVKKYDPKNCIQSDMSLRLNMKPW